MGVQLAGDFEDKLEEAVLDAAEQAFVGERGNLVHQAIQRSHEILRSYAQENDYDVESIIDSLGLTQVDRQEGRLVVRWGWTHPAAPFFEFGTSTHTVEGNPVLSFVWEDPPRWVRQEFEQARSSGGQFASGWRVFFAEVEVEGIPESRFVRDALRWLETEVTA